MENLIYILAVSLVAAAISFTVTITSIFEPLRDWMFEKSKFFGKLFSCPWCFGHYVVAVILGIDYFNEGGNLFSIFGNSVMDFLFTLFLIMGLIGIWHYAIIRSYEPVVKLMAQRQIEKMREQKKN